MIARTRTLAACLASVEAEHSPQSARHGSHRLRSTGPVSYPRQPAPQPSTPDARTSSCTALTWTELAMLALCLFSGLYMIELLAEAAFRAPLP